VRAEDELRIDRALASRAKWQIIQVLEQIFFFQRTLKGLIQSFFRPQDQIQEQPWDKEQHDQ
jgi:hypothetical protein